MNIERIQTLLQERILPLSKQTLNLEYISHAKLLQLSADCEFIEEYNKLQALFSDGLSSEDALKSGFLALHQAREARNHNTALSFAAMPAWRCNKLYWEIAAALFEPENLQQQLAILFPCIKQTYLLSYEVDPLDDKKRRYAFTLAPLDHYAKMAVGESAQLETYVMSDGIILNTTELMISDFNIHQMIHTIISNQHTNLARLLYQWNADFKYLHHDILQVESGGTTPKQAINAFIQDLKLVSVGKTGNGYILEAREATNITVAIFNFKNYLSSLPEDLRNKVMSLKKDMGQLKEYSIDRAFRLIQNNDCTNTTAEVLIELLVNPTPENEATLNTVPTLSQATIAEIKAKYTIKNYKMIATGRDHTDTIPAELLIPIIKSLAFIREGSAYTYILINLHESEYHLFFQHVEIVIHPALPDTLAIAIENGMFDDDENKLIAFAQTITTLHEKFGGITKIVDFAFSTNNTIFIESVLSKEFIAKEPLNMATDSPESLEKARKTLRIRYMANILISAVIVDSINKFDFKSAHKLFASASESDQIATLFEEDEDETTLYDMLKCMNNPAVTEIIKYLKTDILSISQPALITDPVKMTNSKGQYPKLSQAMASAIENNQFTNEQLMTYATAITTNPDIFRGFDKITHFAFQTKNRVFIEFVMSEDVAAEIKIDSLKRIIRFLISPEVNLTLIPQTLQIRIITVLLDHTLRADVQIDRKTLTSKLGEMISQFSADTQFAILRQKALTGSSLFKEYSCHTFMTYLGVVQFLKPGVRELLLRDILDQFSKTNESIPNDYGPIRRELLAEALSDIERYERLIHQIYQLVESLDSTGIYITLTGQNKLKSKTHLEELLKTNNSLLSRMLIRLNASDWLLLLDNNMTILPTPLITSVIIEKLNFILSVKNNLLTSADFNTILSRESADTQLSILRSSSNNNKTLFIRLSCHTDNDYRQISFNLKSGVREQLLQETLEELHKTNGPIDHYRPIERDLLRLAFRDSVKYASVINALTDQLKSGELYEILACGILAKDTETVEHKPYFDHLAESNSHLLIKLIKKLTNPHALFILSNGNSIKLLSPLLIKIINDNPVDKSDCSLATIALDNTGDEDQLTIMQTKDAENIPLFARFTVWSAHNEDIISHMSFAVRCQLINNIIDELYETVEKGEQSPIKLFIESQESELAIYLLKALLKTNQVKYQKVTLFLLMQLTRQEINNLLLYPIENQKPLHNHLIESLTSNESNPVVNFIFQMTASPYDIITTNTKDASKRILLSHILSLNQIELAKIIIARLSSIHCLSISIDSDNALDLKAEQDVQILQYHLEARPEYERSHSLHDYPHPNYPQPNSCESYLSVAAKKHRVNIVKLLLTSSDNLTSRKYAVLEYRSHNQSILQSAIIEGDVAMVQTLLDCLDPKDHNAVFNHILTRIVWSEFTVSPAMISAILNFFPSLNDRYSFVKFERNRYLSSVPSLLQVTYDRGDIKAIHAIFTAITPEDRDNELWKLFYTEEKRFKLLISYSIHLGKEERLALLKRKNRFDEMFMLTIFANNSFKSLTSDIRRQFLDELIEDLQRIISNCQSLEEKKAVIASYKSIHTEVLRIILTTPNCPYQGLKQLLLENLDTASISPVLSTLMPDQKSYFDQLIVLDDVTLLSDYIKRMPELNLHSLMNRSRMHTILNRGHTRLAKDIIGRLSIQQCSSLIPGMHEATSVHDITMIQYMIDTRSDAERDNVFISRGRDKPSLIFNAVNLGKIELVKHIVKQCETSAQRKKMLTAVSDYYSRRTLIEHAVHHNKLDIVRIFMDSLEQEDRDSLLSTPNEHGLPLLHTTYSYESKFGNEIMLHEMQDLLLGYYATPEACAIAVQQSDRNHKSFIELHVRKMNTHRLLSIFNRLTVDGRHAILESLLLKAETIYYSITLLNHISEDEQTALFQRKDANNRTLTQRIISYYQHCNKHGHYYGFNILSRDTDYGLPQKNTYVLKLATTSSATIFVEFIVTLFDKTTSKRHLGHEILDHADRARKIHLIKALTHPVHPVHAGIARGVLAVMPSELISEVLSTLILNYDDNAVEINFLFSCLPVQIQIGHLKSNQSNSSLLDNAIQTQHYGLLTEQLQQSQGSMFTSIAITLLQHCISQCDLSQQKKVRDFYLQVLANLLAICDNTNQLDTLTVKGNLYDRWPLCDAVKTRHIDVVKTFLPYYSKIAKLLPAISNINYQGESSLSIAILLNEVEIVKLLLESLTPAERLKAITSHELLALRALAISDLNPDSAKYKIAHLNDHRDPTTVKKRFTAMINTLLDSLPLAETLTLFSQLADSPADSTQRQVIKQMIHRFSPEQHAIATQILTDNKQLFLANNTHREQTLLAKAPIQNDRTPIERAIDAGETQCAFDILQLSTPEELLDILLEEVRHDKIRLYLLNQTRNIQAIKIIMDLLSDEKQRLASKLRDKNGLTFFQTAVLSRNIDLVKAIIPSFKPGVYSTALSGTLALLASSEAVHPDMLTILLDDLPYPEQVAFIADDHYIALRNTVTYHNAPLLKCFLNKLAPDDRLPALQSQGQYRCSIIQAAALAFNASMIDTILEMLPPHHRSLITRPISSKPQDIYPSVLKKQPKRALTCLPNQPTSPPIFSNDRSLIQDLIDIKNWALLQKTLATMPINDISAALLEEVRLDRNRFYLENHTRNIRVVENILIHLTEAQQIALVNESLFFQTAVMSRNVEMVKMIIQCLKPGVLAIAFGVADQDGNTIFHRLAMSECVPSAMIKLLQGEALPVANHRGDTAFHCAIRSHNVRMLMVFLNLLPIESRLPVLMAKNSFGESALQAAATAYNPLMMKAILRSLSAEDHQRAVNSLVKGKSLRTMSLFAQRDAMVAVLDEEHQPPNPGWRGALTA